MKSTAFGDRAKQLATWFQEWNKCEQTIVLYSLLTKVSATQARFFSLVLEHVLKNGQDSQELARMETDANNPAFLSSIHSEQDSVALSHLLSHILLLHPGNDKAREEYLKLLPKVLFGSAEDPEYLYQCRQLLSLALVHPAFPYEDREKLTFWLSRLGDKCRNIAERNGIIGSGLPMTTAQTRSATLPVQNHMPSSHSPPRRIYQLNTGSIDDIGGNRMNGANRIYITLPHNSTQTPPFSDSFDALGEVDTHPLFEEDDEFVRKGFTLSSSTSTLSSMMNNAFPPPPEHCSTPNSYDEYMKKMKHVKSASLPPNRSPSACSLPAMLDDQTLWKQGMKDVPIWLKSLRLHKYQELFVDMTYESLLNLTGEFLDTKNITRGARNKILISIKKLRQRAERLAEIEQDIEKPGELLSCIGRIRSMLLTPIKAFTPSEDQPTTATTTTTSATTVTSTTSNTSTDEPTDSSGSTKQQTLEAAPPLTTVASLSESPQHHRIREDASSGGSSCSTPPSSPRLHRSSSMSSVDDLLAKEFPESDLPSLITKVTGKVFSQLMMHTETNEENLTAFIKLLDSVMCHEAFKVSHKKLFFEWKQQCQQTLRVISPKKSPRNKGWPNAFTIAGNPPHPKVNYPEKKTSRRNTSRGGTMGPKVPTTITGSSPRSSSTLPRANPSRQFQPPFPPPYYPPPRSRSNTGPSVKQAPIPIPAVLRAHRYVNLTMPKPLDPSELLMDELCKSVTEHALEEQSDS